MGPTLQLDDILEGELQISPTQLVLSDGASGWFGLHLLKADGTLLTNFNGSSKAVWKSSAPAIASVSESGSITAKFPGHAIVSVQLGTMTAEAPVIVVPTPVELRPLAVGEWTGLVGASLPDSVGVMVIDRGGLPVSGVDVWFEVEVGGGSVSPTTAVTGANGVAKAVWRMGGAAGTNALSISAEGLDSVILRARAETGGDDTRIEPMGGDDQDGIVGEALAQKLRVRVVDAFGNSVPNAVVEWAFESGSSDTEGGSGGSAGATQVSTTDSGGSASTGWRLGPKSGEQRVTAKVSGSGGETWFRAKAKPGKVTSLTLDPSSATLGVRDRITLKVQAGDRFGNSVTANEVSWHTSDASVASVSSAGAVEALGAGQALITAKRGNISASVPVSVQSVGPASLTLVNGNGQSGKVGKQLELPFTVRVLDATGTPLPNVDVTWTVHAGGGTLAAPSSKTDGAGQARVSYTLGATAGVNQVRAIAGGLPPVTFTASASAGGVAAVEVTPRTATISAGQARQFTATAVDGAGNGVPGISVTWSSSSPRVATVDGSGKVSGVSAGSAVITANAGGTKGTATVSVTRDINRIVLTGPATPLNAIGDTLVLQAQALDASGTAIPGTTFSWTSQNPAIASVDQLGRVVSTGVGTAAISASAGGHSDSATVTARQIVAAVSVVPGSPSVGTGSTLQMHASAADSNGVSIPGITFMWQSSDASVATVTAAGLAQGIAAGSAQITATMQSGSGSAGGADQATAAMPTASVTLLVQSTSTRPPGAPSTWIYPGEDLNAAVAAHPGGTTFTIKTGVHRLQMASPKPGMAFLGEPGAVMTGAVVLTGFTPSGGGWEFDAPLPTGLHRNGQQGNCRWERTAKPNSTECWSPQDLFWDGQPLERVANRSQVGLDQWYLDESSRRAYVSQNPSGHTVEFSSDRVAFSVLHADGVRIEGLRIERYASLPGYGAIQVEDSRNVIIRNNVIRQNHGAGVVMFNANHNRIEGNDIIQQGQIGISTWRADDLLIQGNRIDQNNQARYDEGWEAGAMKMVRSARPIVRSNDIRQNIGKGIWTDADNTDALFESNNVLNNTSHGIFHEVSCGGVIRNNVVRGNATWGIVISGSPDTEVHNNTVGGNGWVIGGSVHKAYGEILARTVGRTASSASPCQWDLTNIRIHHNRVEVATTVGTAPAAILFRGGNSYLPPGGVKFFDNTYQLSGGQNERFRIGDQWLDRAGWRAAGYDVTSQFQTVP